MNLLRRRRSSFEQLEVYVVQSTARIDSRSAISFEHDFGMDTYPKATRKIFGRLSRIDGDVFPCQNEIEDSGRKDL